MAPLPTGIGNPFNRRVAWSTVRADEGKGPVLLSESRVEDRLVAYVAGGYETETELRPWKGYWVRNNADEPVELLLPSVQGTLAKEVASTRPGGWRLQVRAWSGPCRDEDNWVGALQGALDGLDRLDRHEPPPAMEPGIRLYVTNEKGKALSSDYRAPDQEEYEWKLAIEGEKAVTVQVEGVEQLPEDWQAWLVDEYTQERYDLLDPSRQVLPGIAASRQLVLWVGKDAEKERTGLLPTTHRLLPARPNPFNSSTAIRYVLAAAEDVQVAIYSLDGRRVQKWGPVRQDAGWHEVLFDGRDAQGRTVASGVYFIYLKAGSFEGTGKLTLVR